MVFVARSISNHDDPDRSLLLLTEGLGDDDAAQLLQATQLARATYGNDSLATGESTWMHALGMALIVTQLKLDAASRLAAIFFALYQYKNSDEVSQSYASAATLIDGISRLKNFRSLPRNLSLTDGKRAALRKETQEEVSAQIEVLRKMLLAMVEDIRVVLLRLASRLQSLRYYSEHAGEARIQLARETLAIYSPLANRLGVWELKWEMEDLAFRYQHPEVYKRIAGQLEEKRIEREQFINEAIARLQHELGKQNLQAEVSGRPKHIYSIWNKMRNKGIGFSEVYDIRALRIIVDDVKDCYTALGVVHNLWQPLPREFDDYISKPKSNDYRSLHTAMQCPDGRALEVQIRTREMHQHAELGVAAHWRYKEGGQNVAASYDEKIAWLRQLISWRDDVSGGSDWHKKYRQAAFDETVYVMTPQGKVVDLPHGATPIDFAYRIHTDLGHRCRGAKVDDALLPLNTPLATGQKVEIISSKTGGPSRDWLSPAQGYIHTKSARVKVRQWFAAKEQAIALNEGRALINREMHRLGQSNVNIEEIASRLDFANANDLYLATARGNVPQRSLQAAIRGDKSETDGGKIDNDFSPPLRSRRQLSNSGNPGILIVGVNNLLTQLANCCKPVPPEEVQGFITRGKGIAIHRSSCTSFTHLAAIHPERVIEANWSAHPDEHIAADVVVDARDRAGLLHDVSEVFSKEKQNVSAVKSRSKGGCANMRFTIEVASLGELEQTIAKVRQVADVVGVRRG